METKTIDRMLVPSAGQKTTQIRPAFAILYVKLLTFIRKITGSLAPKSEVNAVTATHTDQVYVECAHGFVHVAGTPDDTITPVCTRPQCIRMATKWHTQHQKVTRRCPFSQSWEQDEIEVAKAHRETPRMGAYNERIQPRVHRQCGTSSTI